MTNHEVLLSAELVAATYGGAIAALHNVTFAVARGEIVALLGANGAGKTTTLRAVSNLLPAERGRVTSGAITFAGIDVRCARPGDLVRAGIAPVLEGRRMFRSLTIEDNLVTGAIARGSSSAEQRADLGPVYALFPRLADKRRLAAGLASGGEQQMAAIGRALMSRPRLLVLDEPSMGLAPLLVQSIFAALLRLNEQDGLAVLIAEQNAAMALRHAHRAVVLENGVAVLAGAAADLRRRPDVKSFYLGEATSPAA